MATVYEIVQGLSQAAANAYDGALNEKGEPIEAGLQREVGDPILDKRVTDGFNVRFHSDKMCVSYQSEVQLKEVYANGFESEVEQRIADIVKFLKKITGNAVTITKEEEIDMIVERTSNIRSWVTAHQVYKVGGLGEGTDEIKSPSRDRLETNWKKFLDLGGWNGTGGKRPDNDTRKKGSEVEKK